MLHITQMLEEACEAVAGIGVAQGRVMVDLYQSEDFTLEQKNAIVEMLKPIDNATKHAREMFVFDVDSKKS
tara:strand:+ start:6382 stop:6594 length:213 start_codon:yes stop_codon:yes gene_type:complete